MTPSKVRQLDLKKKCKTTGAKCNIAKPLFFNKFIDYSIPDDQREHVGRSLIIQSFRHVEHEHVMMQHELLAHFLSIMLQ